MAIPEKILEKYAKSGLELALVEFLEESSQESIKMYLEEIKNNFFFVWYEKKICIGFFGRFFKRGFRIIPCENVEKKTSKKVQRNKGSFL